MIATGDRRLDCAESCEIPDGVELKEVPRPRHAWSDVVHCPNDGCEKSFLVVRAPRALDAAEVNP